MYSIALVVVRLICSTVCVLGCYLSCLLLPFQGQLQKDAIGLFGRGLLRSCGFRVKVSGRKASPSEAPIIVAAPHTSFFDVLVVFWLGLVDGNVPYSLNRIENQSIPILGWCIECTEALFVNRSNPLSRSRAVKDIIARSALGKQGLIFPEGSTSDGRRLFKFKPGAFIPNVPVQPVLILSNQIAWFGNQSAFDIVLKTLQRPSTDVELVFLDVVTPPDANASVYAENVRGIMSRALRLPMEDTFLL